ncbi:MAG: TOBE domain-containing protein [Desulfovibrio sp.]|nr:TOBE domain-containing protein [Desulfovibrio sp.]
MSSRDRVSAILNSLDADEKRELLAALLADSEAVATMPGKRLPATDLARAERWLWERAEKARAPRQKDSRIRMWFIFMLLRYGGLRLPEIFRLAASDFDFDGGIVYAREGDSSRIVPIPIPVAKKMKAAWELWRESSSSDFPFRGDAGQIRRAFKDCEKSLALPAGLVNARSMRRVRGRELEFLGLGAELIEIFMGRERPADERKGKLAARLLKGAVQGKSRSSARNVFPCVATRVDAGGIIVDVALETVGGLEILARITDTSRAALDLAPGIRVRALVKAPWVSVFPAANAPTGANNFYGTVSAVKSDGEAVEVIVALPEGVAICALFQSGTPENARFAAGDEVVVGFDPFAVILVRD